MSEMTAPRPVTRESALASVRAFLEQWDSRYPPELQIHRTWDGDIIHVFSSAAGTIQLRISDLRALVTAEPAEDGEG
jgi:hypothetical protein